MPVLPSHAGNRKKRLLPAFYSSFASSKIRILKTEKVLRPF